MAFRNLIVLEDNLQLADIVRFRVTVDSKAEPGLRDIRLVLPGGTTNRLFFEVGELPDVAEDPASTLSASASSLPVTFNGQVLRSDVDRFRFPAVKGQQLVLRVKGRVFVPYMADAVPGWFQPIIRLYGPDGKEVAFNDDYSYHVDPVLVFDVPRTGDYEVEINDALYRGREDFVYRIDVGELPFITSVSPLGGQVGEKRKITLRGYNLKRNTVTVKPTAPGRTAVSVKGKGGIHSNVLWYDAIPLRQLEAGRSDALEPDTALDIFPAQFCGRCFEEPLQQHWYKFKPTKRGNYHFEVVSRRLGAPTDVRMTLFDASMKVIRDVDDTEDPADYLATHFADPDLTLNLKPGTYYIRMVESQARGGEEYAYLFSADGAKPDFSLTLEPASFSVPVNGTGVFNVHMNGRQNFRKAVDIEVSGLPEGFTVSGNRIEEGRKKTIVSVSAPKEAETGILSPVVKGTAQGPDGPVTREAVAAESMMQAFYYVHLLPMDGFRMEVGEEQPFRLRVDRSPGEILALDRGSKVPVRVFVDRKPGYDAPVTLMLRSSESIVKAEAVVVPSGESEGVLEIEIRENAKAKRTVFPRLSVYGVVKGSSKKIAGKARNAYVASVTAYAPVFVASVEPEN